MIKFILPCLVFSAAAVSAAPAVYSILPISTPPVIDGNLQEWTEAYFIDSLRSDDNIRFRDSPLPWTREDFQYMAWAAHDETKVYFGLKIIADDVIKSGSALHCDDAFIIIGSLCAGATFFEMFIDGTITLMISCPFTLGSTLFAAVNPAGNGTFATAEFSLDKTVLDPFNMKSFQATIGFSEGDAPGPECDNSMTGCIGLECPGYLGDKQRWTCSSGDDPLWYPTFNLVSTKAVRPAAAKAGETLSASPNPFMPATTLSYNAKNSGSLAIYDIAGKVVKSFAVTAGAGRLEWNANNMPSGIYMARLISGKSILNARLFLTR